VSPPATVGHSCAPARDPGTFVAIDFETADEGKDSACAVALVRVEGGVVVAREARLIRPPRKDFVFTHIHGIDWPQVQDEPAFADVWPTFAPLLRGVDLLVAHNASFDRAVLAACCDAANLEMPELDWACTVALARKAWPAWRTHKLDAVCGQLGIALQHHDALSDAEACAEIYLRAQALLAPPKPQAAPALATVPEYLTQVTAANGAFVLVCLKCGMPNHFRGYALEDVLFDVARRHAACSGHVAPIRPVVVSAPPAVAPVPAIEPGQTGALFADVAPAGPKRGGKKVAAQPASTIAWSPLQRAIFDDVRQGAGHVRILARAGSGKSTTIVEALRHVPEGLTACLMAFGREARDELSKRVKGGAEVLTTHGLGYRAMANAYGSTFYAQKGRELLHKAFPGSGPARKSVGKLVGLAKNRLASGPAEIAALADEFKIDPEPVARITRKRNDARSDVALLVEAVQAQLALALKDTKRIDFDDMLWMPVRLDVPLQQWDRLFVDEAQDLNPCQIAMLPRAITPGGRITVVGDDRQAIYAFRGADKNAFDRLGRELSARTLPLTVSYRCPRAVAEVAREFVPDFESGPSSAEGTVRHVEVIDPNELEPGDFVISRKNAPLVTLCLDLLAKDKPAIIQGKDVAGELEDLLDRAERENGRGSLAATIAWLDRWHGEQVAVREVQGDPTDDIDDQHACLTALLRRCSSLAGVRETLRRACGADREGSEKIVLTSAHKAKGLERERCFVLESTFLQRPGIEEQNLYYVAVTRAKRELVLVGSAA
jgi:DNA helicase-2/ATP-dependent DNA helicase PcrA